MYTWLLERDQHLKVGMFSSYRDSTAVAGWSKAQEFEALLMDTTDAIHARFPERFQRYFIQGNSHCIVDYSREVKGVPFRDWAGYMVSGDPRWVEIME